jgi:PAS domain S-box-containing protein
VDPTPQRLPTSTRLALTAALVASVVLALASVWSLRRQQATAAGVRDTLEVISALEDLQASLAEATALQRGYLLTRQPAFRDRFLAQQERAPALLARVEERVADDPVQRAALAALAPRVRARLVEERTRVARVQAGEREGMDEEVGSLENQQQRERLGAALDGMRAHEQAQLEARSRADARARWAFLTVLLVGSGLLCGLTLLAGHLMRRDHRSRLAVEAHLRERTQAYRTLFEEAGVAKAEADAAGRLARANRKLGELLGCSPQSLSGRSLFELLHPEEREGPRAAWEALLRGERAELRADTRLVRADGRPLWVGLTATPTRGTGAGAGAGAGAVVVVEDLTLRRAAEERLRLLAAASDALASVLRPREALARLPPLAVPGLADWAFLTRGEELLGASHAERPRTGLVRALHRFLAEHPEAPEGLRALVEGRSGPEGEVGEALVLREAGPRLLGAAAAQPELAALLEQLRPVSWMRVPVRVHGRTEAHLTLVSSTPGRLYAGDDLVLAQELVRRTSVAMERARLFALAEAERQRAEEASRLKDEFLATLSHELRTPLTSILGWTQLLRSGALRDEAKRGRALETVERNARAQAHLVEDLLDISRITSGTLALERRAVDLASSVGAALDAVRPSAVVRGVHLEADLAGAEGARVTGDPTRLQQVAWNLLSNAVKFSPRGTTVHAQLVREGGWVRLSVRDEGAGIPADFLPHVFERFRQADGTTTRRHGGLGLGLSIVRSLVELHGGRVEAQSGGEGRGATFTVHLPLAAGAPQALPQALPQGAHSPQSSRRAEGGAGREAPASHEPPAAAGAGGGGEGAPAP